MCPICCSIGLLQVSSRFLLGCSMFLIGYRLFDGSFTHPLGFLSNFYMVALVFFQMFPRFSSIRFPQVSSRLPIGFLQGCSRFLVGFPLSVLYDYFTFPSKFPIGCLCGCSWFLLCFLLVSQMIPQGVIGFLYALTLLLQVTSWFPICVIYYSYMLPLGFISVFYMVALGFLAWLTSGALAGLSWLAGLAWLAWLTLALAGLAGLARPARSAQRRFPNQLIIFFYFFFNSSKASPVRPARPATGIKTK